MSAEGFLISNPKGNNRDLVVTYLPRTGTRKKLKTLRPGEAYRCERREVQVTEAVRPPRLQLLDDGSFVEDKRR